jgi:hypothetical protein
MIPRLNASQSSLEIVPPENLLTNPKAPWMMLGNGGSDMMVEFRKKAAANLRL